MRGFAGNNPCNEHIFDGQSLIPGFYLMAQSIQICCTLISQLKSLCKECVQIPFVAWCAKLYRSFVWRIESSHSFNNVPYQLTAHCRV